MMDDPSPTPDGRAYGCPACDKALKIESWEDLGDSPCPHCSHLLWFVRKTVDDVVVLTFVPGLMLASESLDRVDEVRSAVGDATRAVLDLSQLNFLSSLFLGMLVALHRQMEADMGHLKICGIHPDNRESFRFTRLDTMLNICEDEPSALQSF
jgi:anti-anti-sigma factor